MAGGRLEDEAGWDNGHAPLVEGATSFPSRFSEQESEHIKTYGEFIRSFGKLGSFVQLKDSEGFCHVFPLRLCGRRHLCSVTRVKSSSSTRAK